jgi:hypothetical protein
MTKQKEKEEPLTKEEAEKQVADLPPAIRATLDKYWQAYRDLRQTFGPGVHITRDDVAFAAGTNIDMASNSWRGSSRSKAISRSRPARRSSIAKPTGAGRLRPSMPRLCRLPLMVSGRPRKQFTRPFATRRRQRSLKSPAAFRPLCRSRGTV